LLLPVPTAVNLDAAQTLHATEKRWLGAGSKEAVEAAKLQSQDREALRFVADLAESLHRNSEERSYGRGRGARGPEKTGEASD
jgi:hypothetical protein